jgi:hypothetical protein
MAGLGRRHRSTRDGRTDGWSRRGVPAGCGTARGVFFFEVTNRHRARASWRGLGAERGCGCLVASRSPAAGLPGLRAAQKVSGGGGEARSVVSVAACRCRPARARRAN